MRFVNVALVAFASLGQGARCTSAGGAPVVQTSSGKIKGHAAPNVSGVWEFLGIRYAQPPVGELRFAAPESLENSSKTSVDASSWPMDKDCPANLAPPSTFPNFTGNGAHIVSIFTGHTGNPQSEDCLALNIWTKSCSSSTKKPVLIFLHGGRFAIPGPHNPFYQGQYLAGAEDLVIVTINYRLGIFGFPGGPGLTQNVGLLDQRAAVEWVKSNIAGFGGDTSRIILWGQSAGAASVDYYSYAYKSDPIIAGLISDSGTALSFNPNTPAYSLSSFYNVSGTLGCGGPNDDPATVVACVRQQTFSAILAAVLKAPPLPSPVLAQPVFHPTVDNVTVFSDYSALSAAHAYAKIPYLLGNNANEDGTYRVNAFAAGVSLTDAQWAAFDRAAFTCPTMAEANSRSAAKVPVWRWFYNGVWPNLNIFNNSGTYHGSDLTLVFGTTLNLTGQADTAAEATVGKYFMNAFAAFAKNPTSGLTSFGWPVYNPKTASLNEIALADSTTPKFVKSSTVDSQCPAVNNPTPGMGAF
ncbi:cholinesterase precursor [Rhizodiscina lignyota]|uniref:Carboxylic ester hydrolase n=1 Tax=Rhizodiscina lignyota TaxID=1504668 RepID=A0A9P4ICH6_9PEZI|nr:cholinesterase precursor [Rhizodiscina lignyota]